MSYTTKIRKFEVEREWDETQPNTEVGDIRAVTVGVNRSESGRNGSSYSREVRYTVADGIAIPTRVEPLYPNPDEWDQMMKVTHMGHIMAHADYAVGKVPEVEAVRSLAEVLLQKLSSALEGAETNAIARPPDDVTVGSNAFKAPDERPGDSIAGTDYPEDFEGGNSQ